MLKGPKKDEKTLAFEASEEGQRLVKIFKSALDKACQEKTSDLFDIAEEAGRVYTEALVAAGGQSGHGKTASFWRGINGL